MIEGSVPQRINKDQLKEIVLKLKYKEEIENSKLIWLA